MDYGNCVFALFSFVFYSVPDIVCFKNDTELNLIGQQVFLQEQNR
jgi:hypothetical protein